MKLIDLKEGQEAIIKNVTGEGAFRKRLLEMGVIRGEKIKVVRIIDRMNIGGPAIHCSLLTSRLNSEEFSTILITGQVCEFEGDMGYLLKRNDIKPVFIKRLKRNISFISDTIALWEIMKIIYKEKPDIIHTHKSKAGLLGRLAAIILGVPVIVHTFHGHIFHSYFSKIKTKFFIIFERILAMFTTKIIVISKQQYQEICSIYKIAHSNKFQIIKLGFNFAPLLNSFQYQGILRKKYNINENEIIVGIVGRLACVKNHLMFLKAAKIILQQRSNIKFFIIGDGELKQELTAYTGKLEISDNVFFTGWIKNSAKIYSDLDIVALTSKNEGTPVTLIEAVVCQKPVVATKVGGVIDIIQDKKNGLLVEPNNAEKFAQAIINIIDNPGIFSKSVTKNSLQMQQNYGQKRLINDIENLYRKLSK